MPARASIPRPLVETADLLKLSEATSPAELTDRVAVLSNRLGFEYWIYGALVAMSPSRYEEFVLSGYPDGWRQHYLEQKYTYVDPTVNYARAHVVPSLWDDLWQQLSPEMGLRAKRIFAEAREFGLAKGLSVPLHGLGCAFGMMSFAAVNPKHPILESTVYAEASMLAIHTHQAASKLYGKGLQGKHVPLSDRQRECLKWAAEGKTSWEIGELLSISERTVVFHLANAARKLKVVTRPQAIAKALVMGVLDED